MENSTPIYYDAKLREAIYRYRSKNRERYNEYQRTATKKWSDNNKEKRKEINKAYYAKRKLIKTNVEISSNGTDNFVVDGTK